MRAVGTVLYENFEKKNFTLKIHNMKTFAIVVRNCSKMIHSFRINLYYLFPGFLHDSIETTDLYRSLCEPKLNF